MQGVSIEMSKDLILIQRNGYTLLDILSDVGGMQGFLLSVAGFFVGMLRYHDADAYLLSRLFDTSQRETGAKVIAEADSSQEVDVETRSRIKYFCFQRILCDNRLCFKREKKEIVIETAYAQFLQEADLVHMIRSIRFFHLALEKLLDSETHKRLTTRSKFTPVDTPETMRFANEQVIEVRM